MERPRNAYGALEEMAKTIALPGDYPPHRMPTFPALERTAVLSFTDTFTFSVPKPIGATIGGPYAMLSRCPAYPLWVEKKWKGSQYSTMSWPSQPLGVSAGTLVVPIDGPLPESQDSAPFSEFPCARFEGDYFYLLGGAVGYGTMKVAVQCSLGAGAIAKMSFQVEAVDSSLNRIAISLLATAVSSSGTTFAATASLPDDWIAVRFTSVELAATAAGISMNSIYCGITDTTGSAFPLTSPDVSGRTLARLLPAIAPPEFDSTTLQYQSVRCTASSVLLSNVTAVMQKEGTILAARLPATSPNALNPSLWAGFGRVHPKERYFGALENGLYAFTLPDTPSESFHDCVVPTSVTGATAPVGIVDLSNLGYVYCVILQDIDAASATTIAVTSSRHLEFRTSSRLFPTSYSKYSLENYHVAQMSLVQLGCFTENPVHLAAISRMVAQAARVAWPHIRPYAVAAVTHLGNKAISYVGKKLGDMSQKQMTAPRQPSVKKVVVARRPKARRNKRGKQKAS